ncbi:hypothetical protein BCR34DRAFT_631275 [Clohesyomyces aquaticus]|uniref:N-acetyltransferase domain-containing protein n=1 Tax=Clohesyomyces aquaticus TaxID=1231657 RepID=A0A1Y1ZAV9_9PLEO|nr:hypothetical protein BCR34DRAFT_631275 [Clohesyomyces aquaticus]
MASEKPTITVTSTSGKGYLSRTSPTMVSAFSKDTCWAYFLNHLPRDSAARTSLRRLLFHCMFSAAALKNATFYEASYTDLDPANPKDKKGEEGGGEGRPFQSAAIILPPGEAIDNISLFGWLSLIPQGLPKLLYKCGPRHFHRILFEYGAVADSAKRIKFPLKSQAKKEGYFYVLIIGTEESCRGRGLAGELMKRVLRDAEKAGKPVWLEATSLMSMELYERLGFRVVGKAGEAGSLVLGKGKCDASGENAKGEEAVGVKIWPMVWIPEGCGEGEAGRRDSGFGER